MNSSDNPYSETTDSTSSSLLRRVKAHDEDAWKRLVFIYEPLVYSWCRRWGTQAADADDLVQEVFAGVATGIAKFERNRGGGSFRGWLWKITRNKFGDFIAKKRNAPEPGGQEELRSDLSAIPDQYPTEEEEGFVTDDAALVLQRTLSVIQSDFQEHTWQIFTRATFENHTTEEIAKDLGMTNEAVRRAKHRVMQRLREELRDLSD